MNFPADGVWPPYDADSGFAAVVGAMVAIAAVLLGYFRYRGWI